MQHFFRFLVLVLIISASPCQSQTVDGFQRFAFTHASMGSEFRIICYAQDAINVRKAVKKGFARIDSLNAMLSDYISFSEIMQLSQSAGSDKYYPVSDDLFRIIAISNKWAKASDGAFDITIGALTQLWRRTAYTNTYPDAQEISRAMEKVNYQYIHIDSSTHTIMLEKQGMMLDAGGVAKGYAVDEVGKILEAHGIEQYMIDGAGDMLTGDPPPNKRGWKIAIENLAGRDSTLVLANQAVATSGDLYRYIEMNGKRYSHIIDPKTGYGLTKRRTVTVIADNATNADALASVLSVIGPESGENFIRNHHVKLAIVVEKKGDEIERFILKAQE